MELIMQTIPRLTLTLTAAVAPSPYCSVRTSKSSLMLGMLAAGLVATGCGGGGGIDDPLPTEINAEPEVTELDSGTPFHYEIERATVLAVSAMPSAPCTSQLTPLTPSLREGIPLPQLFSNPTDNDVTFILTMQQNALFGQRQEVYRVTLPPKTGRVSSPLYLTGLRTSIGSARVTIDVTTDRTGTQVIGKCDYQVSIIDSAAKD
jgi:hypothetical protein